MRADGSGAAAVGAVTAAALPAFLPLNFLLSSEPRPRRDFLTPVGLPLSDADDDDVSESRPPPSPTSGANLLASGSAASERRVVTGAAEATGAAVPAHPPLATPPATPMPEDEELLRR